tara:strand:- start:732 stop:3002 length:2271 start_codon:yes stop_codon:yes gene_type:complete
MKSLNLKYKILNKIFLSILLTLLISKSVFSNNLVFEINGNQFTDTQAILSLLNKIPENANEEYSNEIIKVLNESNLFSDVRVNFDNNKYKIFLKEFPNIDNLYFKNNERLKDEELEYIASEINLINLNNSSINLFINEIKKIYESFGYNNINIEYSEIINQDSNTADIYFNIIEGTITKINKIIINGNKSLYVDDIKEVIRSKTKSIRNIFANNNYKPAVVERDKILITEYYKNNGYLDINVKTKIEYLESNKVNIYFEISEGNLYKISSIKINDKENILRKDTLNLINEDKEIFLDQQKIFSINQIQEFKQKISTKILESDTDFFGLNYLDNVNNFNVDILFEIVQVKPKYIRQINIIGNSRTFDYVIRSELELVEGDPINDNQIKILKQKLSSLNLFKSIKVKEEIVDKNNVNLIIDVEEKQTGTFNAGVSVGTLDGFAIVTGLRERNFYGTGRSLDLLLNTSEDKNQFKLITTDRLSYENDVDISYNINYRQEDFSSASSYKLDTFSSGFGIAYKINKKLRHNIDIEYVLKDYKITDSSTVSNSIASSSGANISYLIKNNIRYSTLNPGFISKKGNFINFNNTIETPTSSSNGFIRNIITLKKYLNHKNNIISIQTKLGNIFSLNNKDILTDNKFALGGKWLRGFDSFGAGPRNSRTSYVGGNNIVVTKLDYSYELTKQSNFPIYFNIFNDYGLIWDNKTKPNQSDNNLRASIGYGIKYYSPIGPIGFTWGFPIMDEEYDIKRMFLFSIGNID